MTEYENITSTANQQFLETNDDGNEEKIIQERVNKEVSKLFLKVDNSPREGQYDDENPPLEQNRGVQRRRTVNELSFYQCSSERQPDSKQTTETDVTEMTCIRRILKQYEGNDDALYKFKEGDLHRLRIQYIEDMLLLLVQGKVTNLSVEELNQKKLNHTNPTRTNNLRRQDALQLHDSDPESDSFTIKEAKKIRLMRIDVTPQVHLVNSFTKKKGNPAYEFNIKQAPWSIPHDSRTMKNGGGGSRCQRGSQIHNTCSYPHNVKSYESSLHVSRLPLLRYHTSIRSVKELKLKNFPRKMQRLKLSKKGKRILVQHVAIPQMVQKYKISEESCADWKEHKRHRSLGQIQVQGTSSIQEVNDHYNIFTRERQEYEIKTKDKA
ncbi:hypothetical protein Tco_0255922 [Tanacetum coccineum]